MPISRERFDSRPEDNDYKTALEFLKTHSDEAFEAREVAEIVYSSLPPTKTALENITRVFAVADILNRLVGKGLVDTRTLDGKTYYSIRRPRIKWVPAK